MAPPHHPVNFGRLPTRIPSGIAIWIKGVLLCITIFLVYQPCWHGLPVWDDEAHLTQSPLQSYHGLFRIWLEPGATQQYYPLTHTFFWFEHLLWGDSMLGYHLVSISLHALSALLLVAILLKLSCRCAWLAAAIWALHPLQVESVAWISELKNTLSGACFLGSALLYLHVESLQESPKSPESPKKALFLYLAALGLFLCGLLAKSVIAILPVVLFLVLLWKKHRRVTRWDLLSLSPFLGIGMISGLYTAHMEQMYVVHEKGFSDFSWHLSLLDRLLVAGRAFWFYLGKLCWPTDLTFIYPHWKVDPAVWWQSLYPMGVVCLFACLLAAMLGKRTGAAPLTAFLCYVTLLFPAMGFLDVYPFRYSFVANHFQYLAGIAPIALFASAFQRPRSSSSSSEDPRGKGLQLPFNLRALLGFCLLFLLALQSHRLSGEFKDEETLWRATLRKNPDSSLALNNLGNLVANRGSSAEAVVLLNHALEIDPDFGEVHCNLGLALMERGDPGDLEKADFHLKRAAELTPSFGETQLGLGQLLLGKGEFQAGVEAYRKAALLNPHSPLPHNRLGEAFSRQGDWSDALVEYGRAVSLDHGDAESLAGLGSSLLALGRVNEALDPLKRATVIHPSLADAHNNLGIALIRSGRMPEAVKEFELAVQLNPANENYQRNLHNARDQASGPGTGKP